MSRPPPRLAALAVLLPSVLVGAGACSSTSLPTPLDAGSTSDAGSPGDAAPASDSGTGALLWYMTCGDSICPSPTVDAGPPPDAGPPCPAVGTSCATKGQTCGVHDPNVNCGATLVCDDHDPAAFGCPVSSRAFKKDVSYLDEARLAELHDETLRMRLATYEYRSPYGDPTEKHLGFIIEDRPQSPAVDRGHDRVDMYGYLSMVVATMQVQEKEIEALRREVADARRQRASAQACPPNAR